MRKQCTIQLITMNTDLRVKLLTKINIHTNLMMIKHYYMGKDFRITTEKQGLRGSNV